jgi:hypothetical protein
MVSAKIQGNAFFKVVDTKKIYSFKVDGNFFYCQLFLCSINSIKNVGIRESDIIFIRSHYKTDLCLNGKQVQHLFYKLNLSK